MPITTTLLAAANELLLNVGEQGVGDLGSSVGRKAAVAFQRALRFVSQLHSWSHLTANVTTPTWIGATAALPPVAEVYAVSLRQYMLSSTSYDRLYDHLIRTSPLLIGTPQYWSRSGSNVLVYPEPVGLDKPLVVFRVLRQPVTPLLAADSFTLPDDFYDAVQTYAEMLLHRNHTTDAAAAQACAADFELRIHMLRSRETSQPVSNLGMLT